MFQQDKVIGFEYVRNGKTWHLSNTITDPEVVRIIGKKAFRAPPVVKSTFPPQYDHLRRLVLVLAKRRLDGGSIHEEQSGRHYRVTITVKERQKKPGHHKDTFLATGE